MLPFYDRPIDNNLGIGYGEQMIVENLNLHIPKGKVTTMIGPNGCGKSTILKTMARIQRSRTGAVYLNGKAIHQMSTHQLLIPASALTGALLFLLADLIGRMILAPSEIPVGLVIAALGAPYFIYLLMKTN
ncbi:ATP-binding cassette domain-containing protein [Bacillus licheniformis]|nr:ATP-binding cassette domain-containing protein [Bacillus licheniformis]